MTNKVKGEASFKVGEKEYTLNYHHGALIKLEKQLDKGIVKIIREVERWQRDPEELRLETALTIFWAGLQKHHPEITIDMAGDLMSEMGGVPETLKALMAGLASAFGEPDEGVKQQSNPTQATQKVNGTGIANSSATSQPDTSQKDSGQSLRAS